MGASRRVGHAGNVNAYALLKGFLKNQCFLVIQQKYSVCFKKMCDIGSCMTICYLEDLFADPYTNAEI